jgi:Ca2+-binding RTX toxin-like protein
MTMRRLLRNATSLIGAIGLAMPPLVLGAAPGYAAPSVTTVQLISGQLLLVDAPFGQQDVIGLVLHQVPSGGEVFEVTDQTNSLSAVAPCASVSAHRVSCPGAQLLSIFVNTRDGDDLVANFADLPGTVNAGDGNDEVLDGPNRQRIDLGTGDDTSIQGTESDELFGGPGTDWVTYNRGTSVCVSLNDINDDGGLYEDGGTCHTPGGDNIHSDVENIQGGSGDDLLWGNAANNVVDGGTGQDQVAGEGGDDLLPQPSAPDGEDRIIGDAGIDTVSYESRTSPVTVQLDLFDLDPLVGPSEDSFIADVEIAVGTNFDDVLIGNALNNTLRGLGGNDRISGARGADLIDGGAGGSDTGDYRTRTANVVASLDNLANDGQAGEGDNILNTENIAGGSGNDILTGDKFRNTLTGGAGADAIRGLDNDDVLSGGPGTDLTDAGNGADLVTYADHTAAVTVSLDNVANDGQAGENDNARDAESIIGGAGNDVLVGNAARNTLRGLFGNDRLFGVDENDTLIGSEGTDFADGGNGADACQAEATNSCP